MKIFNEKYTAELTKNKSVTDFINHLINGKIITLVYGAKDENHTHALVLQNIYKNIFNEN